MFGSWSRRVAIGVATACIAMFGVGVTLAVQANASGGSSAAAGNQPATVPLPPGPHAKVRPAVLATNASCGQTITASLTLNGDLVCSGNGLTISGTGAVVLNLNGHQISGPGTSLTTTGIELDSKSATVENGIVTSFYTGVAAYGTTDTVSNVRVNFSRYGINDFGTGTKLTNCVVWASVTLGIAGQGSGSVYSGDHELNNQGNGLYVYGSKITVTGNVANGNAGVGIGDIGGYTTLTKNTANFNFTDGIYTNAPTATDGGGNTAKGNNYGAGTPEQCHGVVCS